MLRTRVLEIHWRILQWVCLRDVVSRISATLKSFPFITGMDASLLSKKEHALLGNYHRYSPHCWLCFLLFFLALTPCHFHCKDIRFLSGLVNKVLELRTVCCEAQPYLSYSQRCVVHFHMLRATFISEDIVVLVFVVFFKLWCQINVNGLFFYMKKVCGNKVWGYYQNR